MKIRSSCVGLSFVFLIALGIAFKGGSVAAAPPDVLTETIVKEVVTRQANHVVDGTISAPKSITVTFESVKIGTPRKASKADEFNGIPPKATIYPVRVKYTVVYHYSRSDETNSYYYDYVFFKDSFNEWKALGLGPVR